MNIRQQEDLEVAILHLKLAYAFHRTGKLESFLRASSETLWDSYDGLYCDWWDILNVTVDFFAVTGDEDGCYNDNYYFSDAAMREYYRLVRVHARRHHLKFKKDPYFVKAHSHVYDMLLAQCPYHCWFRLTTKSHHEYGCGLSVGISIEEFSSETDLILGVLDMVSYYQHAALELQAVLAEERKHTVLAFKASETNCKEAA